MSILKVAKAAGVSHSTVSRVINGLSNVHPQTAALVKNAMKKIGYTPPAADHRRGPRSRRQKGIHTANILVAWTDISAELIATNFAQSVNGIIAALQEHHLTPIFCCIEKSDPAYACRMLEKTDGCIMIGGNPPDVFINSLRHRPIIWLSSRRTAAGDFIIGGNETVGQLAADYLIHRGHKNLAFLDPFPENPANSARRKGFEFAAFQNKIKVKPFITASPSPVHNPDTLSELEAAAAPLIHALAKSVQRPTGLFLPQDMITAAVYPLLYRAGVRPGVDIDIVSANNEIPYLAGLFPRPATIDIGCRVNGRHAVQQLLWRLRQPEGTPSIEVIIEPVLIPGQDSGYFPLTQREKP